MAPFCLGQRPGRRGSPADPHKPVDSPAGIVNDIGLDAAGIQEGRLRGPLCTSWPARIGTEKASALSLSPPPYAPTGSPPAPLRKHAYTRIPDPSDASRRRTCRQAFPGPGIAACRLRDGNPAAGLRLDRSLAGRNSIAAHTSHHASRSAAPLRSDGGKTGVPWLACLTACAGPAPACCRRTAPRGAAGSEAPGAGVIS